MKKIAIVLVGIFLSGCATTRQYLPVADQNTLSPGNVLIKVERHIEFVCSRESVEVSDDGKVVGQLAPGGFLIWQRPAGIFQLKLIQKDLVVRNPVPVIVDGKSGQQYDFEIFWGLQVNTFELHRKIPQL